jgi:transcriptional regulator with XRE-family HTH domain
MIQKRSDESRPLIVPQFRAGRGLIGWSQSELAEKAGLSLPTVKRVELETTQVSDDARSKMRKALEAAGVEFIPENGGGAGVRLRKQRQDRNNLDHHIERLEGEVAHLKPAASGKPSPAAGMAMLRRGRAKSELAKAKNKRAKGRPK